MAVSWGNHPTLSVRSAQQAESLNERDQRRQQQLEKITQEEMQNYAGDAMHRGLMPGSKPSDVFRQRLQREMPDLPDEHVQAYADAFDRQAPRAFHTKQFQDVLTQEKTERYQNPSGPHSAGQAMMDEAGRLAPFLPYNTIQDWRIGRAQDRMREGKETEDDRRLLAQHMIAQEDEANRGTGEKIWRTASALPSQLIELETAGGLAKTIPGKVLSQGLGMTPRKFSQGMMPGVQLDEQGNPVVGPEKSAGWEAARATAGGLTDAAIMHGVGQAGKALRGVPEGATPGLLERAGVYGPVEGVVMGRAQEFVGGATGLRPDMGLVGELFSGDPERQKKALMEMGTEGAAFALVGGGEKLMGMRVRQLNSLGLSETEARQRAASEMKALRERFEQIKAQNADWMQQVLPGERQRLPEQVEGELGPVARTAGRGLLPPEAPAAPARQSTGESVPSPPEAPGNRPASAATPRNGGAQPAPATTLRGQAGGNELSEGWGDRQDGADKLDDLLASGKLKRIGIQTSGDGKVVALPTNNAKEGLELDLTATRNARVQAVDGFGRRIRPDGAVGNSSPKTRLVRTGHSSGN